MRGLIHGCKQRVAVIPSELLEAGTVLFLALLKIRVVQEVPPLNDNFEVVLQPECYLGRVTDRFINYTVRLLILELPG